MTTIVYYTFGDMLPTTVGNKRAMFEYFRHIVRFPNVRLRLVIIGEVPWEHRKTYQDMGAELCVIPPNARWSLWELANKIICRIGMDVDRVRFSAKGYRRAFCAACEGADLILMTYACWYGLLPKEMLKKTVVITHDILFWRRLSVVGSRGLNKITYMLNKHAELKCLRRFGKIAVLGDYEKNLLVKNGIAQEDVICIGVPLYVPRPDPNVSKQIKYDFLFVGGCGVANMTAITCFFDRVVPLLPRNRSITIGLAGKSANSPWLSILRIPENVHLIKIGFVDDMEPVFAASRIGIGTVMMGSGVKVKVVEMAMHYLPVIVSNKGAEGIPLKGTGVVNIEEDDESEIRRRIACWLDDESAARKDGFETGEAVRIAFDPNVCLNPLRKIIEAAGCNVL
jgi:hypothetical protein